MKLISNFKKNYAKFGRITAVLALLASSNTVHSQCSGNNLVQDPNQFLWTYHPVTANNPAPYYSGVLEVGEASFTMNNGQTLTTRAYRQEGGSYSIPGPTIKVVPGNKYILSFHNTLPYEPLSTSHNVFKDPNASNVHTHGLHISGTSPGDDVTRAFEGGTGGDYVWDIPANHMGGTYWYHAHHHGSSFLQVSGGLFGLLIVDDSNDGLPAPVAAMEEKQLVLGYLDRGAAGTGGDVLLSGTLTSTWTVNGKIGGNICMPSNTWQHWRILLADRDAAMKTITFGPECEVMLLARDGVWRTVAPKNLDMKMLDLTGASRADIAVRLIGTTSTLKIGNAVVATINASGTANTAPHPFNTDGVSTWSATRPNYLRDLRTETNVHLESVSMGARTINGSKFDHDVANITLPANQVQEWSISGASMHPFHLHIYHVQALASTMGFEVGEYYDVLAAKMSVRFDLNSSSSSAYSGRTIMHCHILEHEDQGAMGWLNVTGGIGAPSFPADGDLTTPYSAYYSFGPAPNPPAAPTNLVATASSSSSIGLTWTDNSSDENGFHIERSTDGSTFTMLTEVGANVVSYTDNGLTASTTYFYRIKAFNGPSHSNHSAPSNIASATTLPSGGGGVVMHIDNITVTRVAASGGRYRGVANVYIFDANGAPVSGATVTGSFSGPTSGTATGTTNTSGQATINSALIKSPVGSWCFMVSNVTKSGASYNAAANVMSMACEGGGGMAMTSVKVQPKENIDVPSGSHSNDLKIYPNPFTNSTKIAFQIEKGAKVNMEVYNVLGERVAVIADENYDAGQYQLEFNARNLKAGTYFIRFTADGFTENRMIVLTN